MSKLSQWQKPEYQRARMFHGELLPYVMEYSPSGNTVSFHGTFKSPRYVNGDNGRNIFVAWGVGSTFQRISVGTRSSDHSDVQSRNKLTVRCVNTAGASIFFLLSNIEVNDDREHSICVSFDATAGTFTFLIDMLPADDPTWVNRVVTTGTMGTTANSLMLIGGASLSTTINSWIGEIGFVAHRSAYYVSDWTPFFYPNGQPKRLDMTGWTQWGSQPGLFQPNADAEANMGGIGQFRRIGNIAPIVERRVLKATKDGVQNTGGIVLAFANPRIAKQVTYEQSFPQIMGVGGVLSATIPTIDANGFAYLTGSYATPMRVVTLPAKASTIRLYQAIFRWENTVPTASHGLALLFNWQDTNNYWAAIIAWTGTQWQLDLGQINAGAYTSRGLMAMTGVNYPAHFVLSVYDAGDNLNAFMSGYEVDVPANRSSAYVRYTVASRLLKAATGTGVQNNTDPTTNFRFRNLLVMDI